MIRNNPRPPGILIFIMNALLNHSHPESLMGDYEEIFAEIVHDKGRIPALLWFVFQILIITGPVIQNSLYGGIAMIGNYMRLVFRHFRKNRIYSLIQIGGLVIGFIFCFLIWIFISDELAYDRFHDNVHHIHYIWGSVRFGNMQASLDAQAPLSDYLKETFHEVKSATRVSPLNIAVQHNELSFEQRGFSVDPEFFHIFSFPLIDGQIGSQCLSPGQIIITSEFAKKLFGDKDPVGQSVSLKMGEGFKNFLVSGQLKPIPGPSSLTFDFLIHIKDDLGEKLVDWSLANYLPTFVLLDETVDPDEFAGKFPETIDKKLQESFDNEFDVTCQYDLHAFSDFHLKSTKESIVMTGRSKAIYSWLLAGVGVLVLFLALLNFTNLSIGCASTRLKEIGIRKVLGAARKQVAGQFFLESVIYCLVALIIAYGVTHSLLPLFNHLAAREFTSSDLFTPMSLISLLILTLFASLMGGVYQAIYLSGLQSVEFFRGRFRVSGKKMLSRFLILLQFSITIFFLITAIFVNRQYLYMTEKDLGYSPENIMIVPLGNVTENVERNHLIYHRLKQNIESHASILSVTGSQYSMAGYWMSTPPEQKDGSRVLVDINRVDAGFITAMGLHHQSGMDFQKDGISTSKGAIIVNEKFVKTFNTGDPVGKELSEWFNDQLEGRVVGVVSDFHYNDLRNPIRPAMIELIDEDLFHYLYIRISPESLHKSIQVVKEEFGKAVPGIPFIYTFLNDELRGQYMLEQRWSRLINTASLFAVIIASAGLFGLSLLVVVSKTKEIGIRKVMGANIRQISLMIQKDFILLVLAANVISWPLAYLLVKRMFQDYHYHIPIAPGIFIACGAIALFIAMGTMSFHTVRAGRINPAVTLKYE